MSIQRKAQKKVKLRAARKEKRIKGSQVSRGVKFRVCVFRSLNNIYAQIIDDVAGKTLISFSSLNLKDKAKDKTSIAKLVGEELGKKAQEKSIKDVFFDRNKYLYHGRVRALAEGLRESGLKF